MLSDKEIEIIGRSKLFGGIKAEDIAGLLEGRYQRERSKKGSIIHLAGKDKRRIGILLSGEALVQNEEQTVVLNRLKTGGVFGVSTLFCEKCGVKTVICAKSDCDILFISEEDLEKIFAEDFTVVRNCLMFLSDRIRFLNHKIALFSAPDTSHKLISFLMEQAKNGEAVHITMTELASRLGMGRASLYRELDKLKKQGVIEQNRGCITIKNMQEKD